jgi:hypothetical protein
MGRVCWYIFVSEGHVKLTGKIADNYNMKKDHPSIILYNKLHLVV